MQDKQEKERADAKNAVEEYVYEMRDKLYTSLEPYVKEDVSFTPYSHRPRDVTSSLGDLPGHPHRGVIPDAAFTLSQHVRPREAVRCVGRPPPRTPHTDPHHNP